MDEHGRKNILLLTGPMGSGHIRAALALKEALQRDYPGVRVLYVDTTSWMDPFIRWIFLWFYPFLLNHLPTLWRQIHNLNNRFGKGIFTCLFDLFDRKIIRYIKNTVQHTHSDLIICTHFYPGCVVDKMKLKGLLDIPSVLVVTDHTGHRIYAKKGHDIIFVPSQESADQFVQWGIPREQLSIANCPIFARFGRPCPEAELNRFKEELQLKPEIAYIMLTMGGWAIGDMCRAAKSILHADKEFGLLVMTSRNQKLFRQFSLMAMEDDRILPVSYTDQMEKYMAVCSVVITKPGGLTTSECIAMRKPMLLVDPIAGHEEENLEVLLRKGVAYTPAQGERLDDAIRHMKKHYAEYVAEMEKIAPGVIGSSAQIVRESMALLSDGKVVR